MLAGRSAFLLLLPFRRLKPDPSDWSCLRNGHESDAGLISGEGREGARQEVGAQREEGVRPI
jgi:hypothetical protein